MSLLRGTSEKMQVGRANEGGRAGRTRPPESHGEAKRQVTKKAYPGKQEAAGMEGSGEGSGKQAELPRGENRAPADPGKAGDEALHDMSHSPEPRPCVSAAGERQPLPGGSGGTPLARPGPALPGGS